MAVFQVSVGIGQQAMAVQESLFKRVVVFALKRYQVKIKLSSSRDTL